MNLKIPFAATLLMAPAFAVAETFASCAPEDKLCIDKHMTDLPNPIDFISNPSRPADQAKAEPASSEKDSTPMSDMTASQKEARELGAAAAGLADAMGSTAIGGELLAQAPKAVVSKPADESVGVKTTYTIPGVINAAGKVKEIAGNFDPE